jgi:hypothetical protein
MALSLAFGVLFATFITLFLVPAIYLIIEDLQHALRRAPRAAAPIPSPTSQVPSPT